MRLVRIEGELEVLGRNAAVKLCLKRVEEEARKSSGERTIQVRKPADFKKFFGILWRWGA